MPRLKEEMRIYTAVARSVFDTSAVRRSICVFQWGALECLKYSWISEENSRYQTVHDRAYRASEAWYCEVECGFIALMVSLYKQPAGGLKVRWSLFCRISIIPVKPDSSVYTLYSVYARA